MLAIGADLSFNRVARIDFVLLGQKLHGEMHASQVAPGHGQVAALLGTAAEQDGVKLLLQFFRTDLRLGVVGDFAVFVPSPDHGRGFKYHALGLHLRHAAVDVVFFHFEIRNAVAQQTAHAVILFKHRDRMAGARQLLRSG